MEAVQKKVLSDIFLAPSVTFPVVAGLICWGLSWAAGGVGVLAVAGTVAVAGGLVWMVGRTFLQLDKITARAGKALQDQIRQQEEERIENLLRNLRLDRDFRTKDYVTVLREARAEFEKLADQPSIQARSLPIVGQVRQLFWSAISELEQSYKLFELSDRLVGEQRTELIAQREELLKQVNSSAEKLKSAVVQFRRLYNQDNDVDIDALRDDLDVSIKIAARTEARMKELEGLGNFNDQTDSRITE
ncbi:MAG: hypothetical protein NTW52_12575 [Planctomycetota bacterium]|nr:hypothetical protein [Planctomycetota bacterium]